MAPDDSEALLCSENAVRIAALTDERDELQVERDEYRRAIAALLCALPPGPWSERTTLAVQQLRRVLEEGC